MFHRKVITVAKKMTTGHLGGDVSVLSTPSMIMIIEMACAEFVQPYLEEGHNTVGTGVWIDHTAPTLPGEKIAVTAVLTEVEEKKFSFAVQVFNDTRIIASGDHKRVVINTEKFIAHLTGKK